MIDLHTHSIFSDGELIPFELIRRAEAIGYKGMAITDHVDTSNIDLIVPRLVRALDAIKRFVSIDVVPGAELTHVPPEMISDLVKEARDLGARIVIVHGETIVEPVRKGTNRSGILSGADIISHPGLISTEDLLLAKERGVCLELTSRKGHSLSNGYVAKEAIRFGVPLCINTDAHSPSDLITAGSARNIILAAGVEEARVDAVFEHSRQILDKALRRT